MKKSVTLILAAALVLTLSACGSGKSSGSSSSAAETVKTTETQAAETAAQTAAAGSSSQAETQAAAAGGAAAAGTVSFSTSQSNFVLYDAGGIKVTYVGLEKDKYQYTLKMAYENSTGKVYEAQMKDDTVDGIEEIVVCSDEIAASGSSEGAIILPVPDLEKAGIKEPSEIKGSLNIIYDITENVVEIPVDISLK